MVRRPLLLLVLAALLANLVAVPASAANSGGAGLSTVPVLAPDAPPVLTKVTPNNAPAESPAIALTLDGNGFMVGDVVLFNGTPVNSFFQSPTRMYAIITEDLLLCPGTATVQVSHAPPPPPGVPEVSNTLPFTITNNPPIAQDDSDTTDEDTPVAVPVLANDDAIEGCDSLNITNVSDPANGTTTISGTEVLYTPDAQFVGTDVFSYTIADEFGGMDTATVTITVSFVNDAPGAVDDTYSTNEDVTLTVPAPGVLGNDTDEENDTLSAFLVDTPSSGSLTLNPNGSFVYTPTLNFSGVVTFTYHASDGTSPSNTATVTITVNPVNDAPVAVGDTYTTDEDVTLTVPAPGVLGNDSDVDGDTLTASLVTPPSSGSLTLNADGSFVYTPTLNFSGVVTFTYRANDGTALSNTAVVTITVNDVSDPVVANDDSYSTPEDTTLTMPAPGVLGNDVNPQTGPLTATLVTGPSSGNLTLNPNGSFTYVPASNFSGVVTFVYNATNSSGESDTATVTITVTPINDVPVAVSDIYTTTEDVTLTVPAPGVLGNDSDPEGSPLTAVLVAAPNAAQGTVSLNPNGSFVFTPTANFVGTATFTYRASDGTGQSSVTTVSINVTPTPDPLIANDDSYTTPEDTTLTRNAAGGVLSNDLNPDGGTVTATLGLSPSSGNLTLNPNGSFTYVPASQFSGVVTFTYTASNSFGSSDTATVTITVTAVNDVPVAVNDAYTTTEEVTLTVPAPGVLSNDTDEEGNPLTAVLVTGPSTGTLLLNANGSFTYTPPANFSGTVTFTYRASDGTGQSNVATVTINVTGANDAPTSNNDTYTVSRNGTLNVSAPGVLSNDSDPDGDSLTAALVNAPANGTLTLNADGSFTYTPNAGFSGTDTFTYHASDGTSPSNNATVTITVSSGTGTYLPVIHNNSSSQGTVEGPDLVASISLTPNKKTFTAGEPVTITVVVTNVGNQNASEFWVDLYINPSQPPTSANQAWNQRCSFVQQYCFGLAWHVVAGLPAGQSITLTSTVGSYDPTASRWPGWFASGTTTLYAFVDSYNPGVTTGGVLESNESNNRAALTGLTVTGQNPPAPAKLQTIEELDRRAAR